ncbi:MAG: hypothetical protein F6K23_38855 [Okeania sp. SIO2C9]|uniref:hypothetical protein n=1 Tax=Okeania sp. SIO2C9 TaxID=2607791 RepID=UPI0013C02380|nr:hypothetical protein [Okeania sp. SIO2C9]NEQ78432.1 hypothetical protein [Okeania sp. SIO2C9]
MYRTQAEDTTIEAEQILFQLIGNIPVETRIMQYHRASIQSQQIWWDLFKQHNNFTNKQLKREYINLKIGAQYCSINKLVDIDFMIASEIDLAITLGEKLDNLNIPYYLGGGLASSFWGERRQTEDADIAVILEPYKVEELVSALSNEFYLSETAIDDAMRGRANTFNVIHLASVIKADIYPIKQSNNFEMSAMSRRKQVQLFSTNKTIYIASAEDIILQKLRWYNIANNHSEKQWRDILGVLKARRKELDYDYLKHWGNQLNVSPELERAIDQTTLPG